jgi:ketosteroid isomerase-like protein
LTDTGKYIVVLKKDGADWKISHDIFNSDLPPPPGK